MSFEDSCVMTSELSDAIGKDDLEALVAILEESPNLVQERFNSAKTLLHHACSKGSYQIGKQKIE